MLSNGPLTMRQQRREMAKDKKMMSLSPPPRQDWHIEGACGCHLMVGGGSNHQFVLAAVTVFHHKDERRD
jgi:hypothetical protein